MEHSRLARNGSDGNRPRRDSFSRVADRKALCRKALLCRDKDLAERIERHELITSRDKRSQTQKTRLSAGSVSSVWVWIVGYG
jgi:hypothetical protein